MLFFGVFWGVFLFLHVKQRDVVMGTNMETKTKIRKQKLTEKSVSRLWGMRASGGDRTGRSEMHQPLAPHEQFARCLPSTQRRLGFLVSRLNRGCAFFARPKTTSELALSQHLTAHLITAEAPTGLVINLRLHWRRWCEILWAFMPVRTSNMVESQSAVSQRFRFSLKALHKSKASLLLLVVVEVVVVVVVLVCLDLIYFKPFSSLRNMRCKQANKS